MRGGVEVSPRSIGNIESAAAHVRKVLRLGKAGRICGWKLFDSLEDFKIDDEIGIDCQVMSMRPEGITKYLEEESKVLVVVSESTLSRLEADDPRGLFTLGHEIGHAVLHARDLIRMGAMSTDEVALARERTYKVYCDSEWQANTFAAELIMPHAGVVALAKGRRLRADDLERKFNASHSAAELRLKKLRERGLKV